MGGVGRPRLKRSASFNKQHAQAKSAKHGGGGRPSNKVFWLQNRSPKKLKPKKHLTARQPSAQRPAVASAERQHDTPLPLIVAIGELSFVPFTGAGQADPARSSSSPDDLSCTVGVQRGLWAADVNVAEGAESDVILLSSADGTSKHEVDRRLLEGTSFSQNPTGSKVQTDLEGPTLAKAVDFLEQGFARNPVTFLLAEGEVAYMEALVDTPHGDAWVSRLLFVGYAWDSYSVDPKSQDYPHAMVRLPLRWLRDKIYDLVRVSPGPYSPPPSLLTGHRWDLVLCQLRQLAFRSFWAQYDDKPRQDLRPLQDLRKDCLGEYMAKELCEIVVEYAWPSNSLSPDAYLSWLRALSDRGFAETFHDLLPMGLPWYMVEHLWYFCHDLRPSALG